MKTQLRLAVGGAVVLALFGGFFYSVVDEGVGAFQYYHTLSELSQSLKAGTVDTSSGLRLNGTVVPGSIQKDLDTMQVRFTMTDGTTQLQVLLTRIDVSDLFKDDAMVVVEGKLQPSGVFEASQLYAKCPTKYEAAEKHPTAS